MKLYYTLSLEELQEKYGKEFRVYDHGDCWLDGGSGFILSTEVQHLGQIHNLRNSDDGCYISVNLNDSLPNWAIVEVPEGIFGEL